MAKRNTSIYKAMNIVRRLTTKMDIERQKMFPRICDPAILLGNEDRGNGTKRMETRREYRSYSEAVQRSESSEEKQRSRGEWKIKENKNREEKERRQAEGNRQKRWYKDWDNRETEIQRRDYGIAIRDIQRSMMDREEGVTSPSQSNLTLMTTTRYMTEEMRNLCMIMERKFNIMEEMFRRFEDRQRRQEEILIRMTREEDRRDRSKEYKGREEETRPSNGD